MGFYKGYVPGLKVKILSMAIMLVHLLPPSLDRHTEYFDAEIIQSVC